MTRSSGSAADPTPGSWPVGAGGTAADGPSFYPVVPAGGSGTRLWPLSRAGHPKFLHALGGGDRTLIQATADRLARLAPLDRLHVVTGASHAAGIARQLPDLPAGNIVIEPAPRESGPAIGLAAALLARRDPAAVMGSFAADHLVGDVDTFVRVIRTAIAVAADGLLVTVGITPTGPETGYGYIQCGEPLAVPGAYAVGAFKEKPTAEVAQSYLDSGRYVWNASMFVWRVDALLEELARQRPALHAGLVRIADAWGGPSRDTVLGEVWPTLEKISIDHGVMEDAAARGRVAVVPGTFGWHDVGDWHTLGQVLPPGPDGNVVIGDAGQVLALDTSGAVVVPGSGRLIAVLGLTDVVVVDTPDALLVCGRDRAQQVKAVVDAVKARGTGDLC